MTHSEVCAHIILCPPRFCPLPAIVLRGIVLSRVSSLRAPPEKRQALPCMALTLKTMIDHNHSCQTTQTRACARGAPHQPRAPSPRSSCAANSRYGIMEAVKEYGHKLKDLLSGGGVGNGACVGGGAVMRALPVVDACM